MEEYEVKVSDLTLRCNTKVEFVGETNEGLVRMWNIGLESMEDRGFAAKTEFGTKDRALADTFLVGRTYELQFVMVADPLYDLVDEPELAN